MPNRIFNLDLPDRNGKANTTTNVIGDNSVTNIYVGTLSVTNILVLN